MSDRSRFGACASSDPSPRCRFLVLGRAAPLHRGTPRWLLVAALALGSGGSGCSDDNADGAAGSAGTPASGGSPAAAAGGGSGTPGTPVGGSATGGGSSGGSVGSAMGGATGGNAGSAAGGAQAGAGGSDGGAGAGGAQAGASAAGMSGGGGSAAGAAGSNAGSGGAAGGSAGSGGVAGAGGGAAGAGGGTAGAGGGTAGAGGATSGIPKADADFCRAELDRAAQHYEGFRQAYTLPTSIPRSAKGGSVRLVAPSDWTSGFIAGNFWLLYEHTRSAAYRTAAEAWTQALNAQAGNTSTHDVGFMINNSFGQGLRLTQNAAYRTVVLRAAASLASRFNAAVGATRSWDFGGPTWLFPVIVDNMMNLELLYDATQLGGEARFAQLATTHALTTRTNHFRADASSFHVVDYDPTTGAVRRRQTAQGVSDSSAWARGQAWGLYGFTMSYRESRDARFLEQASAIADFYTSVPDMPADRVPYFDFDAPRRADVPDHRDASAGAIAVSGLLELSRYVAPEVGARYRTFALAALRSLASPTYRAALGTNSHFLLMHSVGHYPENSEIDVAMNYADYYYLESLLRCSAP